MRVRLELRKDKSIEGDFTPSEMEDLDEIDDAVKVEVSFGDRFAADQAYIFLARSFQSNFLVRADSSEKCARVANVVRDELRLRRTWWWFTRTNWWILIQLLLAVSGFAALAALTLGSPLATLSPIVVVLALLSLVTTGISMRAKMRIGAPTQGRGRTNSLAVLRWTASTVLSAIVGAAITAWFLTPG